MQTMQCTFDHRIIKVTIFVLIFFPQFANTSLHRALLFLHLYFYPMYLKRTSQSWTKVRNIFITDLFIHVDINKICWSVLLYVALRFDVSLIGSILGTGVSRDLKRQNAQPVFLKSAKMSEN